MTRQNPESLSGQEVSFQLQMPSRALWKHILEKTRVLLEV